MTRVEDLQQETADVLSKLIRFETVNPPGNERAAMEWLQGYLEDAGIACTMEGAEPERPNLVGRLPAADGADGPVLGLLGHVDTVLADPDGWQHDPWSGDVIDGFLWGRGAIDMKSQVAANCVAAASLARSGWRPARGELKVFSVVDEETGGAQGAQFLTQQHPELAYADMLLNEGGGLVMPLGDQRHYGVCCAEKGTFRFALTARGVAGHASVPALTENALLKLLPALSRLATADIGFDITPEIDGLLRGLGHDPADPAAAVAAIAAVDPGIAGLVRANLGVTMAPTMIGASKKINVVPAKAELRIDARVPAGLGEETVLQRLHEVLGDTLDDLELTWIEQVVGNRSSADTPLMEAITTWIGEQDPGATVVPTVLPAFTDSRWWRAAFPDCVAYGWFPQYHQTLPEGWRMMHANDERIDVRDLGYATRCYRDLAQRLL